MKTLFQYTSKNPKDLKDFKNIRDNKVKIDCQEFIDNVDEEDLNFLVEDIGNNYLEEGYYKSYNLNGDVVYILQKELVNYIFF